MIMTATAIMDIIATPTTSHVFESPELESACVTVAVLVAAGVEVNELLVEDVDFKSDVEVGVAVECVVFILILVTLVGKMLPSPPSPPIPALCDFEMISVLMNCDGSGAPDGLRPSRPGKVSLSAPGLLKKGIADAAGKSMATSTSLSLIAAETVLLL
jgi:hypothetical protein